MKVATMGDDARFGVNAASGGAAFLLGWVARSVMMLVLLVILARLLGPASFGLYTIVIAFYYVIEIVGYLGVDAAIRKRLPETNSVAGRLLIINSSFAVSEAVAIAITLVTFLLSGFIATNIYSDAALAIPIDVAAATVMLSVAFNVASASLLGMRKNTEAAKANVAFVVGYIVVAPLLVLAGFDVLGAVLGMSAGYAAAALLSLFYLNKSVKLKYFVPDIAAMKRLVFFSFPVFVSTLVATLAYSFGVLLLGVYASASVVGNYGIAFKLGSFVIITLMSINSVLLPAFSYALARRSLSKRISGIYTSSLYYTLIFLLPLLAYGVSVAAPLMGMLFSYAYSLAPLYFVVISVGITTSIIGSYAGTLVIGYGNAKRFMLYQLCVFAFEMVSMLILIPAFGIGGLLASLYLIGPVILDVVYVLAMVRQFSIQLSFEKLTGVASASFLVFLLMLSSSVLMGNGPLPILVNAVLLVFAYPPLLALLGGIGDAEAAFMGQVSKKIPVAGPFLMHFVRYSRKFVRD